MNALGRFLFWPVLAGLAVAALILALRPDLYRGPTASPTVITSFAPAVERAAPAVVNIYTRRIVTQAAIPDAILRRLPPNTVLPQRERVQQSLGSGVIARSEGYILTNRHVIAGAADIVVLLHNGEEYRAEIIGSDEDTDLGVLKIDATGLPTMPLGEPEYARVGDIVLAIGNPWGFGHTVTQGIISATGRYGLQLQRFENFIQTDAAINPGNSGGALIDVNGRLLGINTAIRSTSGGSEGIGLATPTDTAQRVLDDIVTHGRVMRAWMGLGVQQLTPALAQALGAPSSQGLLITRVSPGSPAEKADLRAGDILTALNGEPMNNGREAMLDIAWRRPGEHIHLEAWRDGKTRQLSLTLAAEPLDDD